MIHSKQVAQLFLIQGHLGLVGASDWLRDLQLVGCHRITSKASNVLEMLTETTPELRLAMR
jgi:tyrosyl-tRNA synthetase